MGSASVNRELARKSSPSTHGLADRCFRVRRIWGDRERREILTGIRSAKNDFTERFLVPGGEPVARCARVFDEIYRISELVLDVRKYSFEIRISARCPNLRYQLQELFP
jgi:hypothetical protein